MDWTTQLAFLVLLCNGHNDSLFIHFSSYKSHRVGKSLLVGELMAFTDGIDYGLFIKENTNRMTRSKLDFKMYTYSKSLFSDITRNKNYSREETHGGLTRNPRLVHADGTFGIALGLKRE